MSYRRGKVVYSPYVIHDTSFDIEEAMAIAPKVADTILKNNFGNYTNREFNSLSHHAMVMVSHGLTDVLCQKYPEESYNKLSRFSSTYAYRAVKKHWKERMQRKALVSAVLRDSESVVV